MLHSDDVAEVFCLHNRCQTLPVDEHCFSLICDVLWESVTAFPCCRGLPKRLPLESVSHSTPDVVPPPDLSSLSKQLCQFSRTDVNGSKNSFNIASVFPSHYLLHRTKPHEFAHTFVSLARLSDTTQL